MNDIDLKKWREYKEIITDSLWIFPRRDNSGQHNGNYWGNFIPQIPNQVLQRYTKKGEWVLDPFLGSGTTLIECRALGRNGIGIELNQEVAKKADETISMAENPFNVATKVICGDCCSISPDVIRSIVAVKKFQLIIMHPPYHNIIKFSDDSRDLSNAKSVEQFLEMFSNCVKNLKGLLEDKRNLVLVIGDIYSNGSWVPLGFLTMNEVLKNNFKLKSIVVKNTENTLGKRNQQGLWRYRALAGGYYIFKHEYVMIFEKITEELSREN